MYSVDASYFNPPAPRGTGRDTGEVTQAEFDISIHPPLAGRDTVKESINADVWNFNPPAPRGTGHKAVVDDRHDL